MLMCSEFLYLAPSGWIIPQRKTGASSGQAQSPAAEVAAHLHHPDLTERVRCWEIQRNCFRGTKHEQDMKNKKVQYREISHACRAQKGPQPIITILFVMLLKNPSTAGTRGRLLTCWMQIFQPPQQNKSAEC